MLTVCNVHMGEPARLYSRPRPQGRSLTYPVSERRTNGAPVFALAGRPTTPLSANGVGCLVIGIYNLFEGWRYKWKQMCVFYG